MGNGGLAARVRKLAFGISPSEADFTRRGFHWRDSKARDHIERIGRTAIDGFNLALEETRPDRLSPRLAEVDREFWGYAFEGAAMALTVLDNLTPWRRDRVRDFLNGPGAAHVEIVHIGIGFALGRLRRNVERVLPQFDRLFGWLIVDGYGFHEGYYHWARYAGGRAGGGSFSPAARRAFDQGLGRSLWFIQGADVQVIATAISEFPSQRRADLWSGVGIACAYAGGVERNAIEALRQAAGPFQADLAGSASFAAKARQRAGNPTAHTDMACKVLCGKSAEQAAALTDEALQNLPAGGPVPAYELWRRLVRARYETADSPAARGIA